MRDRPRTAAELLADQPAALPDDPALRTAIRQARADEARLLGILDDDPTGSQAVHDVQVVTVVDEAAYEDAFAAASAAASAPGAAARAGPAERECASC